MRILLITDNFIPETNAPAIRSFQHSKVWAEKHDVTIITCFPNFPKGKLFEGYKQKLYTKEVISNITVYRVLTFISPNDGFFLRILDFLSFAISSFLLGIFLKRFDVVISTSPQFFSLFSGILLSKIKKSKFISEIRDLYPKTAFELGKIRSGLIHNTLEKIEVLIYRNSNLIVSVSKAFDSHFLNKNIPEDKILFIPNGFSPQELKEITEKNLLLRSEIRNKLNNKFVISYVGTLGEAHPYDVMLELVKKIEEVFGEKVFFAIAGTGVNYEIFKSECLKLGNIKNIHFYDHVKHEEALSILSMSSASIIILKHIPVFQEVIPSKIFLSAALGIPMLYLGPKGEASKLITNKFSGFSNTSGTVDSTITSIQTLLSDSELSKKISVNSKKNSEEFNRIKLAQKMSKAMEDLVNR